MSHEEVKDFSRGVEPKVQWVTMCMLCGEPTLIIVAAEDDQKYSQGAYVQNVWPWLSAGDREMIINGTHEDCFNKAFPPEDY